MSASPTAARSSASANGKSVWSSADNGFQRKVRGVSRSVCHQHRQLGIGEDVPGGAAEDHLPQPALRIGPFNDEIAAEFLCLGQNGLAGSAFAGGLERHGFGLDSVHR